MIDRNGKVKSYYDTIKKNLIENKGSSNLQVNKKGEEDPLEKLYTVLGLKFSPDVLWADILQANKTLMLSQDKTPDERKEIMNAMDALEKAKDTFDLPYQAQEKHNRNSNKELFFPSKNEQHELLPEERKELKKTLDDYIEDGNLNKVEEIIKSDEFKKSSNKNKLNSIEKMLSFYFYNDVEFINLIKLFRGDSSRVPNFSSRDEKFFNRCRQILLYSFDSLDPNIGDCSRFIEKITIERLFALIVLDKRFIPFGIMAARCSINSTYRGVGMEELNIFENPENKVFFLLSKGLPLFQFSLRPIVNYLEMLLIFDNGRFFLSELLLIDFFDKKGEKDLLKKLLSEDIKEFSFVDSESGLVLARSILYQVFFKKDINKIILNWIKEKESKKDNRFNLFVYKLKAYTALKDELTELSSIDHMFFNAYAQYLKGNAQDLRNLVFPMSKKIYVLAPQKDSETQAINMIIKSLKKLFKEDNIKYLLFDLVEKKYQKKAANDLLDHMGLSLRNLDQANAESSLTLGEETNNEFMIKTATQKSSNYSAKAVGAGNKRHKKRNYSESVGTSSLENTASTSQAASVSGYTTYEPKT